MKPIIFVQKGQVDQETIEKMQQEGYLVVEHFYNCAPKLQNKTLRDWFAGMALQGFLSCQNFMNELAKVSKEETRKELSRLCYAQADSMLAEREKGNG